MFPFPFYIWFKVSSLASDWFVGNWLGFRKKMVGSKSDVSRGIFGKSSLKF